MVFLGKWFRRAFLASMILVVGLTWGAGKAGAQIISGPPSFRLSFGIQTELTSRDVKEDAFVFNGVAFPETRDAADQVRLLGRFSISYLDRIELYGLVGGTNLTIDEFSLFDSDISPVYGGGLHWVFYRAVGDYQTFDLFLDYRFLGFRAKSDILFQPFEYDPVTDTVTILTASGQPELIEETITWREHTVKAGIAGRHDFFEPYAGFRVSIVRGEDHIPSPTQELNLDVREDDVVGIFLGTRIYFDRTERAYFFIEGSVIDDNALNLGVRVRY